MSKLELALQYFKVIEAWRPHVTFNHLLDSHLREIRMSEGDFLRYLSIGGRHQAPRVQRFPAKLSAELMMLMAAGMTWSRNGCARAKIITYAHISLLSLTNVCHLVHHRCCIPFTGLDLDKVSRACPYIAALTTTVVKQLVRTR